MTVEVAIDVVLPRVTESVPRARRLVREVVTPLTSSTRVGDIELCVSEVCTNAVQHAAGESFRLQVEVGSSALRVIVDDQGSRTDDGSPVDLRHSMPSSQAIRGRGLAIVDTLAEELRIRRWPDGAWSVFVEHDLISAPQAAST